MSIPRSLVVDTNILFSFFNKDSIRRQLIDKLLDKRVKIISPHFAFEELINNKEKIKKFSDISEWEFKLLYMVLYENISVVSREVYAPFVPDTSKLTIHLKDVSFFALSLSLNKCPIWSDEKAFSNQSEIKIISTKELLKALSK